MIEIGPALHLISLHFRTGPPVPKTARMHLTPQSGQMPALHDLRSTTNTPPRRRRQSGVASRSAAPAFGALFACASVKSFLN
eukprot:1195698-Prorocentrum_minimum.AAC.3